MKLTCCVEDQKCLASKAFFKIRAGLLGTAMMLFASANFAFDWVDETPVFIFGEPSASVESTGQHSSAKASSFPQTNLPNEQRSDQLQQQISQIDLEILMLKTELAIQNSDLQAAQRYIQEMEDWLLPPQFQQRFTELKAQVEALMPNQLLKFLGFSSSFDFPMHDPKAVVAVILPISGKYAIVAETLLSSLKSALDLYGYQGQIKTFDSSAYPNMFRLWEALRNYQPAFVFGPLQKSLMEDWHHLNTGIPTLYFNDANTTLFSYEKSLSPGSIGPIRKATRYLSDHGYERVLVFSHENSKSQNLAESLQLQWFQTDPNVQVLKATLADNLSDNLADALGVKYSRQRAQVLSRIVYRPVEFETRSRQDVQAIVSVLEPAQAIQVSPILEFHGLSDVPHFWLPAKNLNVDDLNLYRDSWQATTGFFPSYLYQAFLNQEIHSKNTTGIFYALGQVAVEIVNQARFLSGKDWMLDSRYGQVEANQNGSFYLFPAVYWLDQGQISPLEP